MIPSTIDEKQFRYQMPPEPDLLSHKNYLAELVSVYQEKLSMTGYQVEINYSLLCSIVIRVDERKDYYKYFHSTSESTMRISRGKEVALLAYWIVKYKPFRIKGIAEEEKFYCEFRCTFNEIFAAMMILSFLNEETHVAPGFFTAAKVNTMLYDLFNRDISKEAMIMYVESFIAGDAV